MTIITKIFHPRILYESNPAPPTAPDPGKGFLYRLEEYLFPVPGKFTARLILILSVIVLVVTSSLFFCAMQYYRNYNERLYYTDYCERVCALPFDQGEKRPRMIQFKHMHFAPDFNELYKIPGITNYSSSGPVIHERVLIEHDKERITVFDIRNGKRNTVIHDFKYNVTGIVTDRRCFLRRLDYAKVLIPCRFKTKILNNERFDVTQKWSTFLAVPDSTETCSTAIARLCVGRVQYRLELPLPGSAEDRANDTERIIHFSGQGIQIFRIKDEIKEE